MINTTPAVKLLLSFSERELKKLEQMLQSPYFNTNEVCLSLFQLLQDQILKQGKELSKEEVRQLLSLEEKHKSYLSVLLKQLNTFAEEVLVLEQLRAKPSNHNYLLVEALEEKGNNDLVEKIGNQNLKSLNKKKRPTREDYLYQFLFSRFLYDLQITSSRKERLQPDTLANSLDAFYMCQRLPLAYEMINVKQFMSVGYQELRLEKTMELSKTFLGDEYHLIQLFKHAVLLGKEGAKEEDFHHFIKLMADFQDFIPRKELHILFTIAGNYCIQQIFSGQPVFLEHLFSVYQKMIHQNALFCTKYIPVAQLKNVVSVGCQLGKFEWTLAFLEDAHQHINPAIRESYYRFFLATVFFYQKKYAEAREQLIQTESMEVFFELGRKFFLMKIYYELGEDIALFQLTDSFKDYIRKNKLLSKDLKKSYTNATNLLRLISKSRSTMTPKKWKTLNDKLNGYDKVSDKRWLMKKLMELEC